MFDDFSAAPLETDSFPLSPIFSAVGRDTSVARERFNLSAVKARIWPVLKRSSWLPRYPDRSSEARRVKPTSLDHPTAPREEIIWSDPGSDQGCLFTLLIFPLVAFPRISSLSASVLSICKRRYGRRCIAPRDFLGFLLAFHLP